MSKRQTNRPFAAYRLPERYYCDLPHADWQPFFSAEEADKQAQLTARRCRDQAALTPDSERRAMLEVIAEQIGDCRPDARCHNAACPNCNRARQVWFAEAGQRAVARRQKTTGNHDLGALSVIVNLRLAHGSSIPHLREQITRISSRLRRGLAGTPITFLVGAIDISANVDATTTAHTDPVTNENRTKYQLHLWAIGLRHELEAAKPALRKAFTTSTNVHKAVVVRPFDGAASGYGYAWKANFTQRHCTWDEVQDGSPAGAEVTLERNTRNKSPTAAQHAEIAVILNVLGCDRRLILIGLQFAP